MSQRLPAVLGLLACTLLTSACATRSDHDTYYFAERGDYAAALREARRAKGGGIDGLFLTTGASICRDYESVVTVLVASGDFAGAREACRSYDDECAVVAEDRLCFHYNVAELAGADGDEAVAEALRRDARESLHFRWLMIRDDYENRPPRRPIY